MKNKKLFITGILCGLVPLIVGLGIFFTWWAARAWFAINLRDLQFYGFMWLMISLFIATAGLIIMSYCLFDNRPKFLSYHLLGFALILINIPVVYCVVTKQKELDKRAYVKFSNETEQGMIELTLKTASFEKKIGTIDQHQEIIGFYEPKRIPSLGGDSYAVFDTVILVIKDNHGATHFTPLPQIWDGACERYNIGKDFKVHDTRRQCKTER